MRLHCILHVHATMICIRVRELLYTLHNSMIISSKNGQITQPDSYTYIETTPNTYLTEVQSIVHFCCLCSWAGIWRLLVIYVELHAFKNNYSELSISSCLAIVWELSSCNYCCKCLGCRLSLWLLQGNLTVPHQSVWLWGRRKSALGSI